MENPSTGGSLTGRVPWGADSTVRRRVIQAADSLTILLSIARVDTLIKSLEEDKKEIVGKLTRIGWAPGIAIEGVDIPQKGD